MNFENYIRDINDYPKKGIVFKDITPLLGNPEAFSKMSAELVSLVDDQEIDKVVAIESRGFFYGGILAEKLNAGFIPVRKPNKLPYKTIETSYQLEYGNDTLQIHEDAIKKGERIVIHDDILATGGTAAAVCKLVEQLGGEIIQFNFIAELTFLNGKEKLNYPVKSIIKY